MSFWNWLKSIFSSKPKDEVKLPEQAKPSRPSWLLWAIGELGEKEVQGGESPRILWYHTHATQTGNFTEDEIPWCSSFVCSALRETGYADTNNALAKSYIDYGGPCDKDTDGCITVFRWDRGSYHVAFRALNPAYPGKTYLGGNQSNSVRYTDYDQKYIVASRWPKKASAPVKASALYKGAQGNRGVPNAAFVDELFQTFKKMPDSAFEVGSAVDIYSAISGKLGPWRGTAHRRAAGFEAMVALAGRESSWNWNEGRDQSASNTSAETEESGAWQTSCNARSLHPQAKALMNGITCKQYIVKAKSDHEFSAMFTWWVLRGSINHHGPVKRGEILPYLDKSRVEALMGLFELL